MAAAEEWTELDWSELWTNWSTSWISPGTERADATWTDRPTTSAAPTTALRLDQKTCGLFDTCGTGVTDGKVASADYLVAQHSAEDLPSFSSTTDFMSSFADVTPGMLQIPDALLGVGEQGSSFGGVNEEDGFCEVFTDLTDFLLEASFSPEAPKVDGSGGSRKRTVTEALLEAMEKTADDEEPSSVSSLSSTFPAAHSPVDHNDYTRKPAAKKRARTSTVTSDSCESTVSSMDSSTAAVSAAAVSGSCVGGTSVVEMYVERRVKNNIASRRSRESRKQKFVGMEEEAERLTKENGELREKVVEMEALAKHMKAVLVKRLTNR